MYMYFKVNGLGAKRLLTVGKRGAPKQWAGCLFICNPGGNRYVVLKMSPNNKASEATPGGILMNLAPLPSKSNPVTRQALATNEAFNHYNNWTRGGYRQQKLMSK